MIKVSSWVRFGWYMCTGRGSSNLDQAALQQYKACVGKVDPLIEKGQLKEAQQKFYMGITNDPRTNKLGLYAMHQFALNQRLNHPVYLRGFLDRLPHDPRALNHDKIIEDLKRRDLLK